MSFISALKLGTECGLETVGEAVYNIRLRVGQLFTVEDYRAIIEEGNLMGAKSEDLIEDWLKRFE